MNQPRQVGVIELCLLDTLEPGEEDYLSTFCLPRFRFKCFIRKFFADWIKRLCFKALRAIKLAPLHSETLFTAAKTA